MNKKGKIMLAVVLLLAACITGLSGTMETACAAEQTGEETRGEKKHYISGDWDYTIEDDGTAFIQNYDGKDTDVLEIPAEIDGRTVTGFARSWDRCTLKVKTLIIPETVTNTGVDTGSNPSTKLEEIIVKEGNPVYRSENGILYDKQMKTLLWSPWNKKGSLTVPEGVETIGEESFRGCRLSEIYLPTSLRKIERRAFSHCCDITSIVIPENVEKIGWDAFESCEGLKEIRIPEGIKTISKSMFWYCNNLSSVQIPESVTAIENYAFSGCHKLKNINLPGKITYIGKDAFWECDSLENIVIPNQVTSIGSYAFARCDSLKSIRIPDSVKQIGTKAFSGSKKVVIECSDNSYAKKCAQKRGIPYQIINSPSGSKLGIKVNGQSVKNYQTLKVKVKKSYTLQAVRGTDKTSVEWKSSNAKVAIVKNGKLTVKKEGKATITATALNGKKTSITLSASKAAVKVTKVQAAGSKTMKKGSAQILNLTVTPASADNTKVSWKSSDKKIVTVDSRGKITAKKKGTAVITATAKDGSKKKGSIKITVK